MAETLTVTTGFDTWTAEPAPGRNNANYLYPTPRNGPGTDRHIALWMPISGIAGRVILSATLSTSTVFSGATHTLTIKPFAAPWDVNTLTWANEPGVTAESAVTTVSPSEPDTPVVWDVLPLVQAIANGEPNYGWRITNDIDEYLSLYGFNSGREAWTLTIEVSDVPIAPSDLAPAGVVSTPAWVVQCAPVEEVAAVQVQVDPNADGVTPQFDSGEIATTVPELNLADTLYAGLADAGTTYWRLRLKSSDAPWSEWSDWVGVERHVKPTLTVTEPSAGVLLDPSPSIEASVDSGTIEKYRVRVTEAGNRANVFYDSGDIAVDPAAASFVHEVPLRKRGSHGPLVFPVDGDYDLLVRAWDRHDRVSSPGDPSWVGNWQTVTMDVDGAEVPPETLTAVPVGDGKPGVVLTWTRSASPDAFIVRRDGATVARVVATDAAAAPGEWTYTDRLAAPNTESSWTVRAVTGGKQSPDSPVTLSNNPVEMIWILSRVGDVKLDGNSVDGLALTEKRQTIVLPFSPSDVDVVTAIGGLGGTFSGALDSRKGMDVPASLEVLRQLRHHPEEEVTLVWGTVAAPVRLRGLTYTPYSKYRPAAGPRGNDLHSVSFDVQQVDDFEQDGMP